jgi:hypothetical protein
MTGDNVTHDFVVLPLADSESSHVCRASRLRSALGFGGPHPGSDSGGRDPGTARDHGNGQNKEDDWHQWCYPNTFLGNAGSMAVAGSLAQLRVSMRNKSHAVCMRFLVAVQREVL